MSYFNRRDFVHHTAVALGTTAALSLLPASIRNALADSPDFALNCLSDPTANPYTPANVIVAVGTLRNTNGTGCKAATNGTSNLAYHNGAYGSSIRADIVYGTTGIYDVVSACVVVKSGANANKGYGYYLNGGSARLATLDGTGFFNDLSGTTFTYTPSPGDTLSCTYNASTGALQGLVNGVVQSSTTDETYATEALAAGFGVSAGNLNVSVIRSFSGTGVASGMLPLLFSDDFSSGDLSHTQNGISWASSTRTAVSSDNSKGGPYSLKFTFDANSDAEQRFALGTVRTELMLTFDLYIPTGTEAYGGAAYAIPDVNPNNNKLLRLWRGDQSDGNDGYSQFWVKAGASTTRNGSGGAEIARLIQEYGKSGGGVGQFGNGDPTEADAQSYDHFITTADRGTWLAIQIHVKAATAAGNNGVIETWKNGTQVASCSALDIYPGSDAENGFDFGYLLGFANSGFASTTYLFIDNVKIYGQ
jgi:hypothetical protein